MNLTFYFKQISLFLSLWIISYSGDSVLSLESVCDNISLRCIIDNITHICLGIISWLIVTSYEKCSAAHILQSLLCGFFAGAVDVDHFLMAKSFRFKDATNLSSRPPFHNTTLMAILTICFIFIMHFKGHELAENIGWYILVAVISHHLRDAQRRGLWLWPWATKPINFENYLFMTYLFPLAVGSLLKILNKNIVNTKAYDVLNV